MNDRQREQARIRQARRRARLKEEGASVTVTLTKQEEAMLQELCRVRRPGRTTHASVVLSFPFPQLRFLFCQPARDHGVGAGHRCNVFCHAPGQENGPYPPSGMQTGAVTLIQRFGSALNLNVHFHMLFLDGVYVEQSHGSARFRWVKAPTTPELTQLTHTIATGWRSLSGTARPGTGCRSSYLASDAVDDDPMTPAALITYHRCRFTGE
uniref:Transposase IS801/IS1294 domain-containing protein n=1 Tax=Escherichia coli TaxID=562 RepID=A0A8F1IF19_ECOLX|nr:hypothetical protein IHCLGBEB_00022 [Escherichia coli]